MEMVCSKPVTVLPPSRGVDLSRWCISLTPEPLSVLLLPSELPPVLLLSWCSCLDGRSCLECKLNCTEYSILIFWVQVSSCHNNNSQVSFDITHAEMCDSSDINIMIVIGIITGRF